MIHEKMRILAAKDTLSSSSSSGPGMNAILLEVSKLLASIEKRCEKYGATQADLSTTSFRVFLLLRFLHIEKNLTAHISGLHEFLDVIRKSGRLSKGEINQLKLKVDYSGYLYKRKQAKGSHTLQINAAFIKAPKRVKTAIIKAAFAKRRTKQVDIVREYARSEAFERMNRIIRGNEIANQLTCAGENYNLAHLYAALNEEYFHNSLTRLRLVWSSKSAQRRLGYFHPEIHTIAINKKLDKKSTPILLIRYVLYHEMLHQAHGIRNKNGRRYAHTSAFHQDEKKFKEYEKAEYLIKHLQFK